MILFIPGAIFFFFWPFTFTDERVVFSIIQEKKFNNKRASAYTHTHTQSLSGNFHLSVLCQFFFLFYILVIFFSFCSFSFLVACYCSTSEETLFNFHFLVFILSSISLLHVFSLCVCVKCMWWLSMSNSRHPSHQPKWQQY